MAFIHNKTSSLFKSLRKEQKTPKHITKIQDRGFSFQKRPTHKQYNQFGRNSAKIATSTL